MVMGHSYIWRTRRRRDRLEQTQFHRSWFALVCTGLERSGLGMDGVFGMARSWAYLRLCIEHKCMDGHR